MTNQIRSISLSCIVVSLLLAQGAVMAADQKDSQSDPTSGSNASSGASNSGKKSRHSTGTMGSTTGDAGADTGAVGNNGASGAAISHGKNSDDPDKSGTTSSGGGTR